MTINGLTTLRIKKIIAETADTKSFVLEPLDGKPLSYLPGQFLTFLFRKTNGEEDRRNYSVSAIPEDTDPLQITVKRIPNGEYSRKLIDQAKEGDVMYTIGASGFFTFPEREEMPERLFFFAAGSGIAPVFSLIRTALYRYPHVSVVLIYSNPSKQQTIFYHALKLLQSQYADRFRIEFLFSDSDRIRYKRLGIDLLEKLLFLYEATLYSGTLFYICGPFEYMRMITIVLRNQGVPGANIRKELFVIHPPVRKKLPPDQEMHRVQVFFNNTDISFDSQYPETILQTAKRLQIPIPYSCEAGQCGTCAATCLSGKVWMFKNEVLLEEEMERGRVLTCTGYAVGGDVVITF